MENTSSESDDHIGRIKVSLYISGKDIDLEEISVLAGRTADYAVSRGDKRLNSVGKVIGIHEQSEWILSTEGRVASKDINEHFRYLFRSISSADALLVARLEGWGAETYFDVLWESSYLYAGTGPILENDVIGEVAKLNGKIGFDIYQIS